MLFAQLLVALPQSGAPGGHGAEVFVVLARERKRSPMAEPAARFEVAFQGRVPGQIAPGGAAHFHAQLQRRGARAARLPLNREAQAGNLIRMLTQKRLVSVAFVEAGGKRLAALQIEELWQ